ncbi:pkd domain containing protein [Colletotrichum incanum]|uniref:Pkd domain containing protein n=1 Tax=Colletotrichum incanum TaxID=1573173 RepID=A0A161WBS2_COLIC|nr:pkd domain containing protein [Colletotrichum incanum]
MKRFWAFSRAIVAALATLALMDTWECRFFHFAYPTQSENATIESIGFGLDSNAYTVQVTGTNGYRAESTAAKFSRVVAAQYYQTSDDTRIYGYVYGGSGGSNQVIGGIENTIRIWDGAVAMVQATPVSAPNGPSIRAMAGLVLRNKSAEIQDALRPGGSGNPLSIPTLTQVERSMLLEVTKLGVPIGTWEHFNETLDSTYADDFWSKPGYLGTEQSPLGDILRGALVEFNTTVQSVDLDASGKVINLLLDTSPASVADIYGYDVAVIGSNGTNLGVLSGTFYASSKVMAFNDSTAASNDPSLQTQLSKGIRLHVDNIWSLAVHAYYRHQVPQRAGFYGFDQFRTTNGTLYPQRPIDTSQILASTVSGGGHTGAIGCKLIVIQNLMDSDAFPWHADWYRSQVKQQLGDRFDDNYRLWYNGNAEHYYEERPLDRLAIIVPYNGIYQQSLRDISAWVEDGVPAPDTTSYTISTDDNSVQLPSTAAERRGVQPVIELSVDGSRKITVKLGQAVTFRATIEAPPGTGEVVDVEWDLFSTGKFSHPGPAITPNQTVHAEHTVTYNTIEDHVVVVRATSNRKGDPGAAYARVMNLARVNLLVE